MPIFINGFGGAGGAPRGPPKLNFGIEIFGSRKEDKPPARLLKPPPPPPKPSLEPAPKIFFPKDKGWLTLEMVSLADAPVFNMLLKDKPPPDPPPGIKRLMRLSVLPKCCLGGI